METKKDRKGLKITLGIIGAIILLIIGLLGGIYIADTYLKKDEKVKSTDKKTSDVSESNTVIYVNEEEKSMMQELIDFIPYKTDDLEFNELTNQDKLLLAKVLIENDKNDNEYFYLEKATGKDVNDIILKYFGDKATIINEGIKCPNHFKVFKSYENDTMYNYDSNSDKYSYNSKHGGHGAYLIPSVNNHLISVSAKDDIYTINVKKMFVGLTDGQDDIGGTINEYKIYKTYSDADTQKNVIVNAFSDKYCGKATDGRDTCDDEAIYNDYQDQLNTFTYTFKKLDDHFVFINYTLNK